MKFLQIISAAIFLAPAVMSAPADSTTSQTTPVQAISNSMKTLQNTASKDETAIHNAITNAKGNAGATAELAATVNANMQDIANGFASAAKTIAASFAKAGIGAGGQAQALSQSEIDSLSSSLNTLQTAITGVGASLAFQATNLDPAAQAATLSEATALKQSIAPVVNPVMTFANAASKASASAGASVTGLTKAYNGVVTAVKNFSAANGLPGISFPGAPSS